MKRLIPTLLALLLLGCAPSERFVRVAEEAMPKTVTIQASVIAERLVFVLDNGKFKIEKSTVAATFLGSGVFVSPNGHVLTCDHLFDAVEVLGVTVCQYDGTCQGAEILSRDKRNDLALLRVEGPTPYARLADPRKLKVGQEVIAIGAPLGLEFTVTHGIISALNRDFGFRYNTTQSDTSINPGNSGGPLFNMQGEVVGINSFLIPPIGAPVFTGLGFSTASGQIVEFLTRFRGVDRSLPHFGKKYWDGLLHALGFDSGD